MDPFVVNEKKSGETYLAPDPDFISAISYFSSSLPWDRFEKFFARRKLVGLNGEEQLILLRFLVIQELLCLDDRDLLRWLKNQFYLFSFLQPEFKPRLPTLELLKQFRAELDTIGLLEPFRKHCQFIIQEHSQRFPRIKPTNKPEPADLSESRDDADGHNGGDKHLEAKKQKHTQSDNSIDFKQSLISRTRHYIKKSPSLFGSVPKPFSEIDHKRENREVPSAGTESTGVEQRRCCDNCGSHDFIRLKSSQKESSLPAIRFVRCRICGNTVREK